MGSLSDQMLAGGTALHVEAVHGEPVTMLSGPDKGRSFTAVIEIEPDLILTTELGEDPRSKRMIRFRDGNVPNIISQERLQRGDGSIWMAVRSLQSGYLTTDFELSAVDAKDS